MIRNLNPLSFLAIKNNPDIIEEKKISESKTVVYLGFVDMKSPVDKKFAIIKITEEKVIARTETTTETTVEYANGDFFYNKDWNLRETYNYTFKNF